MFEWHAGADTTPGGWGYGPTQEGLRVAHYPSRYERLIKPVIDWIAALVLTIVTLPLFLACAFAIYVSMGSPIILRQPRVGRGGHLFTLYKFRTMLPDRRRRNEPYAGRDRRVSHKRRDDPRITEVGQFLRHWSLDELPQLLNVLKREMSLVGPRPELPQIVADYQPWQHERHSVKPGITGPWQISQRGDKLLHECTEIDIAYIDTMTLTSDLQILLWTPIAALGARRGF